MTDFEELLILNIVNSHKNIVNILVFLEINGLKATSDKILSYLTSLTYPLAVIVGEENADELANLLFSKNTKAEEVVEFIKNCITTGKE